MILISTRIVFICTMIQLGLCGTGGYLENCSCSTPSLPAQQENAAWLTGIPAKDQSGCCSTPGYVCVSTEIQPQQDYFDLLISNFKCFPRSRVLQSTVEQNANYKGNFVIQVGTNNLQDSVEACQKSCEDTEGCSLFVYCGESGGCKNADVNVIPHKSCDLKVSLAVRDGREVEVWGRGADVDFTSGIVERGLPCGYADGVPCCASTANKNALDLGIDLVFPGGCDVGLFCDITARQPGAEFGLCKSLDAASVCGVQNGICGSEGACKALKADCPSGYTCTGIQVGDTMGAAGMTAFPFGTTTASDYCVLTPHESQCGEDGQMCCPGALPGETNSRVKGSCKGDNSLCVDAYEFYAGRCFDYDQCGQLGGTCCPNLYYRVFGGSANRSGNLDQCKDENTWCDDKGSSFNLPENICKKNVENCGTKGNPCCFSSSSTCCSITETAVCFDGSTCSNPKDTSGSAVCQA